MEDNYDEYYHFRHPANFAEKYISIWHSHMFEIADRTIEDIKHKSLLEVGIGFGYFCKICNSKGVHNYTGVEMNENLTNELVGQGYNVICSTIPPFPDIENKVDIIWMSHILEHASDYMHARAMLQSAYEKLNSGGHIVIICPDILSWKNYFYDMDWSHGFPTSLKRVNQILNDVGFNIKLSKHHVASFTNDIVTTSLNILFKLIPVKFFDGIFLKLFKKTYCSSFMSVFGWRQIIVIAQKR